MRYLLRPKKFSITPKMLARRLGCERTYRYPTNLSALPLFDPQRDFIMCWKRGLFDASSDPTGYTFLSSFYGGTKSSQRRNLSLHGVRIPEDYEGSRFVVRPLIHMGGMGWRTTGDPEDYNQGSEYISPLFPKTHEYRLVFCKGQHLITLAKQVNDGTPNDVPWNHAQGSRFVTVSDWSVCRLARTTVLGDIRRIPFLPLVHLVAVDVMYNKHDRTYAVCELNFAPALTIEENINKIVEFYNGRDNVRGSDTSQD